MGIADGPLVTVLLLTFDWATVAVLFGLSALIVAVGVCRASVEETAAAGLHDAAEDRPSTTSEESARCAGLER